MGYKVVVVGVMGNVGCEMLNILVECQFFVDEVVVLVLCWSIGIEVSFGDKILKCKDIEGFDFIGYDIVLFVIGLDVIKIFVFIVVLQGCVVIDNSLFYCYDLEILLVVFEVNLDVVEDYCNKMIIVNFNCLIVQMVVVLKLLYDRVWIKCVVVLIYQLVLGVGKDGMDELWNQIKGMYVFGQEVEFKKFQKQIVFNVILQIDVFFDSGDIKEEWKMMVEMKKIIDLFIKVIVICVCVLVFVGYFEVVNVEFEDFLDEDEVCDILCEVLGIFVIDKCEFGGYLMLVECVGDFVIFVLCICQDVMIENGLNMWIVLDNLCKGVVLNVVQIVELLGNCCLKKG